MSYDNNLAIIPYKPLDFAAITAQEAAKVAIISYKPLDFAAITAQEAEKTARQLAIRQLSEFSSQLDQIGEQTKYYVRTKHYHRSPAFLPFTIDRLSKEIDQIETSVLRDKTITHFSEELAIPRRGMLDKISLLRDCLKYLEIPSSPKKSPSPVRPLRPSGLTSNEVHSLHAGFTITRQANFSDRNSQVRAAAAKVFGFVTNR